METKRLTRLTTGPVRVVERTEEELPPIPNAEAITRWLEEGTRLQKEGRPVPPGPPGTDAGHYQRVRLNLATGELKFDAANWPVEERTRTRPRSGAMYPLREWEYVPEELYWIVDSGFATRPHLTVEQGNALARRAWDAAQELVSSLQEVPGTGEYDWSAAAIRAGNEITRLCHRNPAGYSDRYIYADMADAVAAVPEIVRPVWVDYRNEQLDYDAGALTRLLGSNQMWHEDLLVLLGHDRADRHRFSVVGTRAWLYRFREEKAGGRQALDAVRWFTADRGRPVEGRVPVEAAEKDLQLLATAEQREATMENVLLVGTVEVLRAERDRARQVLVDQLADLGVRREDAIRDAKLARAAVNARLLQISSWGDQRYENQAELAKSARMTRQAVSQLLGAVEADEDEGEAKDRPGYVITCPGCGSAEDVEEYDAPVPNTDDTVDCARCRNCGRDWALDPGADASCTTCGGSGIPGGHSAVRKSSTGMWESAPKCGCAEAA
ncbi:hypothetical protein ACIRPK_34025 [Kitasatospora sp. NPDC101801]|uniref:hypothetical protein n=1 Tax=Kitasatospora sp. NPDC101801 TaxID=3364103 RepID=UPI00380401BB